MKMLLFKSLCLCLVWLVTDQAHGQGIAPVEWQDQAPRSNNNNYISRGWCRFKFSQTYQAGEFKFNVTFDKQLTKFNDFSNWDRIEMNPGFWYYSQSKWNLNNGQEQRIEFVAKWRISTGIERPNGLCIANVGTPSVTTAGPTQSTTSASTTVPDVTTTTPDADATAAPTTTTTTTAGPQATTTASSAGCGSPVDYGNVWMHNGAYTSRGECKLTFDELIPTGGVKVNVTFDKATSSFDDFNGLNDLTSGPAGTWYYGSSKWQINANQEWGYAFQVSWAAGDPPNATCYTNVHCGDNPATTSGPVTTAKATTATPVTTTAAPATTAAPVTTTAVPVTTTAVPVTTTAVPATTTAAPGTTTAPASTTTAPPQTTTSSGTTPPGTVFPTFNYATVIDMSMDFFAAQRSGPLPANNPIEWRGDSAVDDEGNNGEDLSGGYYDAGDHVKFNFPMASSMTLLAWGQYKFSDTYDEFGLSARMRETIKWATDYFLKCWIDDNNNPMYYGQVGDGFVDHAFWGRPEDMTMQRPAFSLTSNKPGSDLAAETASALAAAYLVFNSTDTTYATEVLNAAESLYAFADTYRGKYTDSAITNAGSFYRSSNYNDELMLASAILYEATGKTSYKTKAESFFPSSTKSAWALSWDDKNVLAQLIMYGQTGNTAYRAPVDDFLKRYRGDVGGLVFVDGVLAWRDQWAPLRYAANAALVAVLAADAGIDASRNAQWAQSQIDYMLGNNKDDFSYVIGFGNDFPRKPHHRASSCPDRPATCNNNQLGAPGPNPQILVGGLVGGPDQNGNYVDDRSNFQTNEVACDYNAGFTSALAGLAHFRGLL